MRSKPLFLLAFIILIFSCTPKEEEKRGSQEETSDETSRTEAPPETVLSLIKNKNNNSDAAGEISPQEETPPEKDLLWTPFSGPLHLQSIKAAEYLLPESLMIGTLADSLSYTLAEREGYALIEDFWIQYRKGRIPRELISKKAHPLFLEEMEQYLSEGSQLLDFYQGGFKFSGLSASMNLVLFSDTGYLKALMYMTNENGKWTLDDWEIPFRYWPGEPVPRDKDLLQRRTVY